MESIAAAVSIGNHGAQVEGGGGASKVPENAEFITKAALQALKDAKGNDPYYEFGIGSGIRHCNFIISNGVLPTDEMNLNPFINSVAEINRLTEGAFEMFKEGVLDAKKLVCEKIRDRRNARPSAPIDIKKKPLESKLLPVRLKIADAASKVVGDTLFKYKDTESEDRNYDLGFKAAWTFFNTFNPLLLTYLELLETDSITKTFAETYKLCDQGIEKFKEGFLFIKTLMIEALKKEGLLILEEKRQEFVTVSEGLAQIFYDDPYNRDIITKLYLGKLSLIEVFYNFIGKYKLYSKYANDVPELTDYREIKDKSVDLAVYGECFSISMNNLLKKNETGIKSSLMDPEELARSINGNPSAEKSVKAPKSGGKKPRVKKPIANEVVRDQIVPEKKKKEAPPKVIHVLEAPKLPKKKNSDEKREEFARKQKSDFENNVKAGFSKVSYAELQRVVDKQEAKVKKMQVFLEGVSDSVKIDELKKQLVCAEDILQHHREEFAKVTPPNPRRTGRYQKPNTPKIEAAAAEVPDIKTKEFSVHIRSVIATSLHLTDKNWNPINLEGSYTDSQMQTFKICVLYMINFGLFNHRVNQYTLQYAATELSKALPSNQYTRQDLNHKLWSGELDVFSVFEGAGFIFST